MLSCSILEGYNHEHRVWKQLNLHMLLKVAQLTRVLMLNTKGVCVTLSQLYSM